ncbi:MAG: hypothetical protein H6Q18_362, partial [Bacteroidetes bacterium]|nr:hypothetical protein [Bacteroidota bacterium]
GLYKLVTQGKNMLIVESLIDAKRIPVYAKDKTVSLGDIAIFTETEEVPLGQVLENVKTKENGGKSSIDPKSDNDLLRKYMGEVLPDYDRDRVYPSDIRKLLSWYNILIEANITEFLEQAETKSETTHEKEIDPKDLAKKETKASNQIKDVKQVKQQQPKVNKAATQRTTQSRKMG